MDTTHAAVAHDEQGVTLLEIVVAIAILSIILVTMGLAVGESFRHTTRSKSMVDRSTMNSFAARYFAEDIANSKTVPVVSPTPACGTGTGVINIPREADTVAYVVKSDASSTRLYRRTCGATTKNQLLGKTTDAFTATAAIGPTSTLTISWSNPAYSFTLRGDRRVTP